MAIAHSYRTDLYIGGSWRPGSDDEPIEVLDPSDGSLLATVANATVEDGLAAVDAAEAAAPAWATTPPRERGEILRRAFELMIDRQSELAELVVRENGKALADARSEIAYAAEFFRWFSEEAVRNAGLLTTAPTGANRILVLHQPIGIAVLVTPWNFPAAMATRKLGPALAAGCTTILKPASETPLTALEIGAILEEAGTPPGVVNVLPSRRSGPVVAAIVNDPRVRKLSFTGSTEVGRTLLELAAKTVVNTSMELGGNAPFLVFADADLDAAIEGAMIAKLRNGGEACTAANRFYVEAPIAEAFAERFGEALSSVRVGPGLEEGVQLGPLINAAACDKIDNLIADAVARGARVEFGGERIDRPGFYYRPTVIDNLDPASEILADEIFGPVAPIVAFEREDEAIRLANETEYGLISYVYTGDLARGLRVSEALETGMVGLNRGVVSDPAAPFGGVKQSGIGREGGHDGLLEFTEKKYIATSW